MPLFLFPFLFLSLDLEEVVSCSHCLTYMDVKGTISWRIRRITPLMSAAMSARWICFIHPDVSNLTIPPRSGLGLDPDDDMVM